MKESLKSKKRPKNIKHAVFFEGAFSKKNEEFRACEKDVLPDYYFASLLRRENQEERKNTEEHSSPLEGPTRKEQSFRKKNRYRRKHVFFF